MSSSYKDAQSFLFATPLYDKLALSDPVVLEELLFEELRVDGYCVGCEQHATFHRIGGHLSEVGWETYKKLGHYDDEILIACTRDEDHFIRFFVYVTDGAIQKIGQEPSFADIAIDASKDYLKLLDAQDRNEFHKAIGLSAHGVGIGSFVYLRRIFERLIQKRFDEHCETNRWDENSFRNLRMDERINFLADHLPDFLVKNRKIYRILSAGIHELSEQECLSFFDVLKESTIRILGEDKKQKEQVALRSKLETAISKYEKT